VELGRVALLAHANFAEHAFDHDLHPSLKRVEQTLGFVLTGSELYWPELTPLLYSILASVGYEDLGRAMVETVKPVATWSRDEFVQLTDEQLHGRPFSDVGPRRNISFAALDTRWHLTATNERSAVLACERFAAAAQVLLAELATAPEILLLDCDLEIEVSVQTPPDRDTIVRVRPDNELMRCTVYLPAWTSQSDPDAVKDANLRALVEVLLQVTVSQAEHFLQTVEGVFKRGLTHKLNFGRPYDEAADLIKDDL
jgi:hypothetical protein